VTHVPRVVVVTRPTPYEDLLARHATRNQAEFFLRQRGQSLDATEVFHHAIQQAVTRVQAAIPLEWRRNHVVRPELDRFLFEPDDTVVVVGQDGLVANVAKYLDGQPVIGINPSPDQFDGILVPHTVEDGCRRLTETAGRVIEERTMVKAELDDGQTLYALNELFLGHKSHQSARYELGVAGETVTHSSSGVVVTTGTGGTGWARSIHLERHSHLGLPRPTDRRLAYFVREAFPSVSSSIRLTEGILTEGQALTVTSRMDDGVVFGDGIEADYLAFGWGVRARLLVAERRLRLVR
jgi:NAD kinase